MIDGSDGGSDGIMINHNTKLMIMIKLSGTGSDKPKNGIDEAEEKWWQ